MNLSLFNTATLFESATDLFRQLNIKLNSNTTEPLPVSELLEQHFRETGIFKAIEKTFYIGTLDDSIFREVGMFDESYSYEQALQQAYKSYDGLMLFALEVNKPPTRSEISELTRAFNRISQKMPVALLLKYQVQTEAVISICISERFQYKQEWRQGEKSGKVIILRDIHTQTTHTGHLRILQDLVKPVGVTNYAQLHEHWLQVLDVSILNKKFFQELANWYFWAMDNVQFPDDIEKKKDVRNATNLIRLITRVIFIWFIKEKKLVPANLFRKEFLGKTVKDFAKNKKSENYYHAILQNLFFGTLNQKMDERKFVKSHKGFVKSDQGIRTFYRYPEKFAMSEKEAMNLFAYVPFLNGGLFDCLDKTDDETKKDYFVDGFTRRKEHQAHVPDYLFFGDEEEIDLNEVFGTKNKKHKVKGLINLLDSYKFTVAENTPVEEEIALDPELLGKVFENLLASYNTETQTTARKQTGSFYTPREIVNYMVDESLLEYLKQNCKDLPDPDNRLRDLFSYSENANPFNERETEFLIEAINNCKILDPACGSGAFPMGVLHKMVHILTKLDNGNKLWRELQKQKAIEDTEAAYKDDDKEERKKRLLEINDVFDNNASDYGRKLYLIENCIYGIDIQPIAVQIAKLRFFISLIIDQNKQEGKENFGIRSLPNLETKFVAANSLIGLEAPTGIKKGKVGMGFLKNLEIEEKEKELKVLRHHYFTPKTRREKIQYQTKDKKLREEIAKLLEEDGWDTTVAKQIVAFDPYDQNLSAPFFESEWMFGLTEGFDIVIGNPPYGADLPVDQTNYFKTNYKLKTSESAILFIEKGFNILNGNGFQSYIIPKSFTFASNYEQTRDFVVDDLGFLVDCGKAFESVKLEACVFGLKKNSKTKFYKSLKLNADLIVEPNSVIDKSLKTKFGFLPNGLTEHEISLGNKILSKSILLATISKNSRGEILQKKIQQTGKFPIIGGKEINKFGIRGIKGYIKDKSEITEKSHIHSNSILAQNIVAHITQPYEHLKIIACIPNKTDYLIVDTINQITITKDFFTQKYLWCMLNSKLINWYCYLFILAKAIRTIHFDNSFTSRIPIPAISLSQQKPFITIVDKILSAKEKNPEADTSPLEKQLDEMVYKLYELTEEEIKIVEGENGR